VYPLTRSTSRARFFGLQQFTPAVLFAAGEQGAWYDPSDYGVGGTLFQDVAGTTPVTGVEQFVRLMLDKSKGGVGSNGPQRYNLLTWSEDFSNAAWTVGNATISANSTTAPDGTLTADTLTENTATSGHNIYRLNPAPTGIQYTYSVFAKANGRTQITLEQESGGNARFTLTGSGTAVALGANTATITAVGNGWYRCTNTFTPTGGYGIYLNLFNGSTTNYTGDGTSGVFLWGADLRLTSQANLAPTYQRIDASWTATIPGNHATAPSDPARPILRARYNLLTYTEEFDNGAWAKSNATISANAGVAPNGTTTADLQYPTTTGNDRGSYQSLSLTASISLTWRVWIKASGFNFAALSRFSGAGYCAWINLSNGTISNVASGYTVTATADSGGYWVTAVGPSSATTYVQVSTADSAGSVTSTANGTDGILLWGADLRVTNDALNQPAYQRVAAATDYDTAGFLPYLAFDGTDDAMSTSAIDFSGTDKMTVFAGVRKLSDANRGMVVELSDNANNSFQINAPSAVAPLDNFAFASRGSVFPGFAQASGYAAPISGVLTGIGEISTDTNILRVNGAQVATNTTDQGTGNYGSTYPLFIGSRNNASLWFNGRLTSLIVRGAASSASEIAATESWVNGKTGAY
jgi:hypothetical protein